MADFVSQHWDNLAIAIGLPETDSARIWDIITNHYCEPLRHYHTLVHIQDMLQKRLEIVDQIEDIVSVDLAILFHDIIYDPQSKANEENSAEIFKVLFSEFMSRPAVNIPKVYEYILLTKAHDVGASIDKDLQFFIDIDMSILGAETIAYKEYAIKIRHEYAHIAAQDYCVGRSSFLRSVLASEKPIFASELYKSLYEERARMNISWEVDILARGDLVA